MDEFSVIANIAARSENMGIGFGDRITRIMDLEFANSLFKLRLNDFLVTNESDFAHDFLGIQAHIDRKEKKWVDDFFSPRFATKSSI